MLLSLLRDPLCGICLFRMGEWGAETGSCSCPEGVALPWEKEAHRVLATCCCAWSLGSVKKGTKQSSSIAILWSYGTLWNLVRFPKCFGSGLNKELAQWVKNLHEVQETQETWVWSLGQEDPLEEEMATHSSLANPIDRGAWWAAVRGVAKSQIQLLMRAWT